MTILTICNK